jgi:hypothetical protein
LQLPVSCVEKVRAKQLSKAIGCSWGYLDGRIRTVELERQNVYGDDFESISSQHEGYAQSEAARSWRKFMLDLLKRDVADIWTSSIQIKGMAAGRLPAGFKMKVAQPVSAVGKGPSGVLGYCGSRDLVAESSTHVQIIRSIFCGAIGRTPAGALFVGVSVSETRPKGMPPPADFSASADRIIATLNVEH